MAPPLAASGNNTLKVPGDALVAPRTPPGSRPSSAASRPGSARRLAESGRMRQTQGRPKGSPGSKRMGRPQGGAAAAAKALQAKAGQQLEAEPSGPVTFLTAAMRGRKCSKYMRTNSGGLPVDIAGHNALRAEELAAVMGLQIVKRAVRVLLLPAMQAGGDIGLRAILEQVGGRLKTFVLLVEGQLSRARLPAVVQVGAKPRVEALQQDLDSVKSLFQEFAPVVEETLFHKDAGAVHLSFLGGRCVLPPFVEEFVKVGPISGLFAEAVSDEGEVERNIFVSMTQQLFGMALPKSVWRAPRQADVSLFEVFGNLDGLLQSIHQPLIFGPSYFDGGGAAEQGAESVDQYGALATDPLNAQELVKLVQDATGKSQRPSQYLLTFHEAMAQEHQFWRCQCLQGCVHGALTYDNIWQDRDARIWVTAAGNIKREVSVHAFADLAVWLAQGLFVYLPIDTTGSSKDEAQLRTLTLLLASVPEQLQLVLPPPPADASPRVQTAWALAQRMIPQFVEYASPPPGVHARFQQRASTANLEMGRSLSGPPTCTGRLDVQFLWAMFHSAIWMVADARTRACPERKRLALFAALAFAARLWSITGKVTEPKRIVQLKMQWRAADGQQTQPSSDTAAAIYLKQVGAKEAWAFDPVALDRMSILEEPSRLEMMMEVLDDEGTVSSRMSRVSIEQMREAWQDKRRLVLRGIAGSGKAMAMQGALVDLILSQVQQGTTSRLPLRIAMADLIATVDDGLTGDPLQEHVAKSFGRTTADTLAWERMRVPWQNRAYHQVTAFRAEGQSRLLLTGGMSLERKPLADSWLSDDGGLTWVELTAPYPPWPARYGHQVVVIGENTEKPILMLIGGMGDERRRLRDLWFSDDGGVTWKELPPPSWSGRYFHKAVVMTLQVSSASRGGMSSAQECVVILGGNALGDKGSDHVLRDAWASNNGGYSWRELQEPPWAARYGHEAMVHQNQLWVLGGSGEGSRTLQDVWCMSGEVWPVRGPDGKVSTPGDHIRWEEKPQPPWSPRSGHQVGLFRGNLIVVGGTCQDVVADDAWVLANGERWRRLNQPTWLMAAKRFGHSLVKQQGRVFVSGGWSEEENELASTSMLRTRDLALVIDDLDESVPGHSSVISYLDRLLDSEPLHLVMASIRPDHIELGLSEHLERWGFTGVEVRPFQEEELQQFCERRLGELSRSHKEASMAQVMSPSCREIMQVPLAASIVLHAVVNAPKDTELLRCDYYKVAFEHFLQTLGSAKRRETSEFARYQEAGVDLAIAELAFEVQSRAGRVVIPRDLSGVTASEAKDLLLKKARAGQLVTISMVEDSFQLAMPSMQEFLAAKHLWRRLGTGEPLPPWILKEGSASESLQSCARFFGALALVRGNFQAERFADLRDGFGTILRIIAQAGDAAAARCLLQAVPDKQSLLMAADIEVQNQTALHVAAIHGHAQVVRVLLEFATSRRTLCMELDGSGSTALHCAARAGHVSVAKVLLEFSSDREALLVSPDGSLQNYTPLHVAASSGHEAVIKALLEMADDRNHLINQTDMSGNTPLHCAAENGHEAAARALVKMSSNPEAVLLKANHYDQQMSLHLAAWNGWDNIARALLELTSNRAKLLSNTDRLGQIPLHLAAERGHQVVAEVLLEHAQVPAVLLDAREWLQGQSPLHLAADAGHEACVRVLLKHSPDREASLSAIDKCGRYTPLHLAAEKGRSAAVRAILDMAPERGSLLLVPERFAGQLPLHLAAANGHDEVVRTLLENAPDRDKLLRCIDRSGEFTALHLAVEKDHSTVVRVLLELAPERWPLLQIGIDRWCGFTALHLAAYKGYEAVATVLLEFAPIRRELLSVRDAKGRTAAELASERGNRVVYQLLAHDASH